MPMNHRDKLMIDNLTNSSLFLPSSNHAHVKDPNSIFYKIESYLSILPIFLVIFGTIGNGIAFYVLTRRKLRTQSTMIYFASLTLMDILSLYHWNFNLFFKYQLNAQDQNLENQSMFLCFYVSFMAHFSMQTSAWILAIISIDRYLIVTNSKWKQKYSRNIKFNLAVVLCVILFIAFINFPVAVFNGKRSKVYLHYNEEKNLILVKRLSSRKVVCYNTWFYKTIWTWFALLMECILPLLLMIIYNTLLIQKTYESSVKLKQREQKEKEEKKIFKSISMNSSFFNAKALRKRASSFASLKFVNDDFKLHMSKLSSRVNSNSEGNIDVTGASYSKIPKEDSERSKISSHAYKDLLEVTDTQIPSTLTEKFTSMKQAYSLVTIPTACTQDDANDLKDSSSNASSIKSIVCDVGGKQNELKPNRKSLIRIPAKTDNNNDSSTTDQLLKRPLNNRYLSSLNINQPVLTPAKHRTSFIGSRKKSCSSTLSDRKIKNLRNRHIVVMLSLLTISFAISTVPSAIFYSIFRPIVRDKPYRRIITNSFTLLRHLSHAFNFVIYFTSSSIIKQQLTETISHIKRKWKIQQYFKHLCCCLFYVCPSNFMRSKSSSKTSHDMALTTNLRSNSNLNKQSDSEKNLKIRTNFQTREDFKQINENGSTLALNFYPDSKDEEAKDLTSVSTSILKNRISFDAITFEVPVIQRDSNLNQSNKKKKICYS